MIPPRSKDVANNIATVILCRDVACYVSGSGQYESHEHRKLLEYSINQRLVEDS